MCSRKRRFNVYTQGRQDFEFPNDTVTGTTLNSLAVYNSGGTGVQTAGTSSSDGVVGIVASGAGNGANTKAVITWAGYVSCSFDAANPTLNDYVIASTTQAGKCHDGGTSRPSGVQVIGRVESGGVRVSLSSPSGGGGGSVTSVFGRTGAVTAATGDYSVSQVTGAAVDSTVVHLAGTETITGAKTFSNNVTLSGNLNVAGNINQTGSGPTQWSGQEWTGTTVTVPSGMAFSLGVGSDNTFHCQLASGVSCMPSPGSGMVWPGAGVPNSTGSGWGTSYGVGSTGSDIPQLSGGLLLASEIPNNAANTTGTAANLSGTPTLPNGTTATTQSVGDNSTKLATTAYIKSETYFNWTCVVAGSTSASQNCNWTLPAGLTITGFDFAANTAPVGCTTYPVVQVWDGTAGAEVGSYSIPLSSGTNFYPQVTGSTNVTSGHTLRIKVTTAASGCSTNAAGMVATVTYQMQN